MKLSEFNEGDTVSVTFTGEIQEIYPEHIMEVLQLQLLDDEK